ncbi:MAG: hypothetical protein L3J91_03515, partial [Thermoplasmata archaeon]|nr:hypothetical protein [Thermoplasmata archaeon]
MPLFSAANMSQPVWGLSPGIQAVATLCPLPDHLTPSCLPYDQNLEDAAASATITSANFWNTSTDTYSNPYNGVATASSTGACAKGPIGCSGFSSLSGGFYPYWSLHAIAHEAAWEFGGTFPGEVRGFGGLPSTSESITPTFSGTANAGGVTGGAALGPLLYVTGEATDPAGIARVDVTLDYCSGLSASGAVVTSSELGSSLATRVDGTFNVTFPEVRSNTGTLVYRVVVVSTSGVPGAPVSQTMTVTGSSACTLPTPSVPTLTPANVTPIAGGYSLHWNDSDPSAIFGYTVQAAGPNASVYKLVDSG